MVQLVSTVIIWIAMVLCVSNVSLIKLNFGFDLQLKIVIVEPQRKCY